MINKDCWLINECNHIDCDSFCMRKYKLDYLYNQANISMQQRKHITLEALNPKDINVYKILRDFEEDIEHFVKNGVNIFIHSTQCGNGKTSWSLRLAQAYLNKIWSKCSLKCKVLFINVPRFLLELKRNIEEKSEYVAHIKENVLNCDLVIWDELGTKDLTSFEHENILSLINARLDSGKANIYTSNLNKFDLQQSIGDRLYSRVVNLSYDIELFGPDMRAMSINKNAL